MKKALPIWSVVAAVAIALVFVAVLFTQFGTGEASKEDLVRIRQSQENRPNSGPVVTGDSRQQR